MLQAEDDRELIFTMFLALPVTADVRTKIARAMSAKGLTQTELADIVDVHRSYVSKLLKKDGGLATLNEGMARRFEKALGIELLPASRFSELGNLFSPTLVDLALISRTDAEIATFLEITLNLAKLRFKKPLPEVEPQKLEGIGESIVQIVQLYGMDQGSDGSPDFSGVAARVLDYLNYFFENNQGELPQ